ncbi:NUDIX hydrolase [Balamuthia mandrillaris]
MASESRYRNPALTVDAAVVRHKENQEGNKQLQVLLIRRKGSTFYNHLAFPGGFVDYGEAPENACLRELQEETCLVGKNPKLIGVYGDPQRDPRKHVVTIFYYISVDDFAELKGSDDALSADFYDVEEVKQSLHKEFAFDHAKLFQDLLQFLQTNNLP